METLAIEAERSSQMNTEVWCEVVSKRKKGKKIVEEVGGAQDHHRGEECLDDRLTSDKCSSMTATPAVEANSMVAAEVSKLSERWSEMVMNEEEEWVDVAPRRKKSDALDVQVGVGQRENKPQPPWRLPQPSQSSPTAAKFSRDDLHNHSNKLVASSTKSAGKPDRFCRDEDQIESSQAPKDRFSVLRTEKQPERSPASHRGKQYSSGNKANSDRFKMHRSEHSEKPTTPEEKDKDDMKRKIRSEIFKEIDACLDGTCLKHSDFDMPCKQYLHAIYEKGGKFKVGEAIDVIKASALTKQRDSVRNWPGYVRTLLRNFFDDLRGSSGGAAKDAHGVDNLHGARSPEPAPQSSQAFDSPSLGAKISGVHSDFSPSLRPGGQCTIRGNPVVDVHS